MIAALTIIGLVALVCAALALASRYWQTDDDPLVIAIDALLPQTQCAQCGYPGCRPYAEAVAAGAAIDLCPPGGEATAEALQALLPEHPRSTQAVEPPIVQVARIDEARCIGCTLCIDPCPVDAIVGANKFMHTVLADVCTGCELCIPPCPVDCIELVAP